MTAPDPMVPRIHAALSDLADLGDEMSTHLSSRRDLGVPNSLYACPVGQYVYDRCGVWIGIEYASWDYHGRHGYRWGDLPPEVAAFVTEFDGGQHPELIAEEATT